MSLNKLNRVKNTRKPPAELLHDSHLLSLAKSPVLDAGNLDCSFNLLTETVTLALKIERGSIWFYNEDKSSIICKDLWDGKTHAVGAQLDSADFPNYFKVLKEERTISANNALTHEATKEFSECYLKPLKVCSMLDAPIRIRGEVVGVLCCEKVGKFKHWSNKDQVFAASISDFISKAYQCHLRRKAQQELQQINSDLEKVVAEKTNELLSQRAKIVNSFKKTAVGNMAATVAHEINNPLSIISCYCEKLRNLIEDRDSKDELSALTGMENAVVRMSDVIKELKTLSKEDSEDSKEIVDLGMITLNVTRFFEQSLKNKNIKLMTAVDRSCLLEGQASEISQVIFNLLSNSIDAFSKEDNRWIEVTVKQDHHKIILSVVDSGDGIKAEHSDKIMNPFFSTKKNSPGLGLFISQEIIKKYSGEMFVDPDSANTRFVIKFPLCLSEEKIA